MNDRIKNSVMFSALAMVIYLLLGIFLLPDIGFILAGGFGIFVGNFCLYFFILYKPPKNYYHKIKPKERKSPSLRELRKKKLNKILKK